jgi:hypothetical protein
MKDKNFKDRVSEKKEELTKVEADLAREKARGKEPSTLHRLDQESKKIQEEIGVLESEGRARDREPLIGKGVSILVELQTKPLSQSDQWDRLKKLYGLVNEIEKSIGVRRIWKRTGPVKVRVLDQQWKARKSPSISSTVRYPQTGGMALDAGYVPDPRVGETDIFEFIEFARAEQLQKQGRVEIVDQGNPLFEEEIVSDPRPEILDTVTSLDFGLPVPSADGYLLPEFEKARKELGGFLRLNFESVHQLMSSEKQAGKKK